MTHHPSQFSIRVSWFVLALAGLLAAHGPALGDILLSDTFTLPSNSNNLDIQLAQRQSGRLAPITYSEADEVFFSQVSHALAPNALFMAGRTNGPNCSVSLDHDFSEVPGLGSSTVIEFDVNPVIPGPNHNVTQTSWIAVNFGATTQNAYPTVTDGVSLLFRGNGQYGALNNGVGLPIGPYAPQDDLFHHIRIVISDATDGNPFNGNSPVDVKAYADGNTVPFFTYVRPNGFLANFVSFVAEGEGPGGDGIVRHLVDDLKISIDDQTLPVMAAPANGFAPLVLATGANGAATLPDYTAQAVATDNVAVTSVSQSPLPGSAQSLGVTAVTLTAHDGAGNTRSLNFNVTVNDGTQPAIAAPAGGFVPLALQTGANGTALLPDYMGQAVTSDNVGVTGLGQTPAAGSAQPAGVTLVTITAADGAGNTNSVNFNVTVVDATTPVITGPENGFTPLALTTGANGTALLPDYTAQALTSDNVAVTSTTQSPPAGSAQPAGATAVTVTAHDAAGNTRSLNFNVTVNDGTQPAIAAPAGGFVPLVLQTQANGTALLPDYTGQAVTSDNVGVTSLAQTPAAGSAQPAGITPVTVTVADGAGNTNSVNFNVTVEDATAPGVAAPENGFTPLALTTGASGTALLPDYTAQALTSDNVAVTSITQSPPAGSAQPAGATAVTVTAHDAAGNTRSVAFDVAVADGTKPEIASPTGGFTPLTVTAGADGTAALPDYTSQAVTSDNVAVTSITQVPAPGGMRHFGKTVVTLTAHDGAGNTRGITFDVFITLGAPMLNELAATGGAVPGAGTDPRIPADATFTSFGIPAVDDQRGVAFLGKWKSSAGAGAGLFAGHAPALIASVGDETTGLPGVTFKNLEDPLLAPGGDLAFRATIQGGGVGPANDQTVWLSTGGNHVLVLREGTQITGLAPGLLLKSVTSLALCDGELLVTAVLAPVAGLVTAADDSVLLHVTASGATLLLREGTLLDWQDGIPASAIKTISALLPANGSPGHGRWQADGAATARVTLADKRTGILRFAADGSATRVVIVGGNAAGAGVSAYWSALGLPALETTGHGLAWKGTLRSAVIPGIPPTVTAKNDTVLAFQNETGTAFVAREGAPAGNTGTTFVAFLDPLTNDRGDILFQASLAGPGVTGKNNTALWWGTPGNTEPIARTGGLAPDAGGATNSTGPGVRWTKFISHALPDGPDAGPIFTATLSGPGVTARNNLGLWALDSTGLLRGLLRTGDLVDGRPVIGIHALTTVPGALGAARGYNARGTAVVRVLFSKAAQAVVRIDVP